MPLWVRRLDSNQRSRGYGPRELPLLYSAIYPPRDCRAGA